MEKPDNPCDEYCDFTGPKGWCTSCGRTRAECDKWWKMTPHDANRLIGELSERQLIIAQMSSPSEHIVFADQVAE